MRSGYLAYQSATRARDKLVSLLVRGAFASYGRRSVLAHPVRLAGVDRIAVGSGVYIGAGSWLQVLAEAPGDTPVIRIGDDVRMSGLCVVSGVRSITIGDGALFARNVYVADHGHAFGDDDRPIHEQGVDAIAPVSIGSGAWLGQNVVVLPGASIGRGSIVGANAVVGIDVPDRCVAVGAPARVIRSLDD